MRISELTERKTTRRATRNFDSEGRRIYQEFEYELPYKADFTGSERQRECAKVIDAIPLFLIFLFVFKQTLFFSFLFSIPAVIIVGSVTETIWGTTLGKKFFKMVVIDDFGNFPGFSKSLKRNFLCLSNFYPSFSEYTTKNVAFGTQTFFRTDLSMHMNNKLCTTYIVKERQLLEIKKLLK
ncbi:RDD family protein [Chryseobacterium formosus]|uniref:RDD family protein n=1 Tax=Chryseobacterium formosus TaxID=1537363 RepID=A0ABT3XNR1_9FLAO|nr:RDD family protein [Chryseobacterium formosus]MCX8523291.1 RDD family protein [Chryseobacterium formosus]